MTQKKRKPAPCETCGEQTTRKIHTLNAVSCGRPCDRSIKYAAEYGNDWGDDETENPPTE
jgi:hypothetical protein